MNSAGLKRARKGDIRGWGDSCESLHLLCLLAFRARTKAALLLSHAKLHNGLSCPLSSPVSRPARLGSARLGSAEAGQQVAAAAPPTGGSCARKVELGAIHHAAPACDWPAAIRSEVMGRLAA